MNKWVESVHKSNKRFAIPIMKHPGIDFIGKKIIDAVTDREIQFQAIKAIQERYSPDAATMIMDLTVEAEAFGCTINFSNNEIPTVAERLVGDRESIEKLNIPKLKSARIPQYLKAAKTGS